jgi:ubiquinone/menaquinone biosynthesis C-methylase UbiE
MLRDLLHALLSVPVMYDLMQRGFGLHKKKALLRTLLPFAGRHPATVVDVGGGTGLYKDLWPANFTYVCADSDMEKLRGFSSKYPSGRAVCADAAQLSLRSASVDTVFCSSMSHHVEEGAVLEGMMQEMTRVIKPGGLLVFLDAVSIPEKRLNRLLWRLDRGEHPHTARRLQELIAQHVRIETTRMFSIYYDYVLFIARKQ